MERRVAWHLDWGEGRRPGLVFHYLNRQIPGRREQRRRLAADALAGVTGLLLAGSWFNRGGGVLFLAPMLMVLWTAYSTRRDVRRLLASGLFREMAVTPVGGADAVRDIHLTSVRRVVLIGLGWLVGQMVFARFGEAGAVFSVIVLLILPPVLWRVSVLAAVAEIRRNTLPGGTVFSRRLVMGGALSLLLVLLMLVLPLSVLTGVGIRSERLYTLWLPLSLLPGLTYTGFLIRWLKRHNGNLEVGRILTARGGRLRELLDRELDL